MRSLLPDTHTPMEWYSMTVIIVVDENDHSVVEDMLWPISVWIDYQLVMHCIINHIYTDKLPVAISIRWAMSWLCAIRDNDGAINGNGSAYSLDEHTLRRQMDDSKLNSFTDYMGLCLAITPAIHVHTFTCRSNDGTQKRPPHDMRQLRSVG